MGKKDTALSWYLNKSKVFADLCNGIFYEGEKRVFPDELAEVQTTYAEEMKDRNGECCSRIRGRDVAKLLCRDRHFVLIAVENQDRVNYTMPVRNMEYDALELRRQLRRNTRRRKLDGSLETPEERLSGMKKTDKLIPMVTIVFYHGEGKWEAAEHLQDMLDMTAVDEKLRSYTTDYKLHVVNMAELNEENFETGLRELVGLSKCRNSKEKMRDYCEKNAERLRGLAADAFDAICAVLNLKRLRVEKEKYKEEGGKVNMCKAFEDMMKESEMQGERRGEKRGERRGRKQGHTEGEEKLGKLIRLLLEANRTGEALEAASNNRARQKLYQEFEIL